MGRPRFSHYIVTRGDKPCVLLRHPGLASDGVLVPDPAAVATKFLSDRNAEKYPTIYARRRAFRAVERTLDFLEETKGSVVDMHEFVQRVRAAAGEGAWKVVPVKCPPPESK